MNDFPDDRTDDDGRPASSTSGGPDADSTTPQSDEPDRSRTESSIADGDGEAADTDEASPKDAAERPTEFESRGSGMRGRDVEVPMRVYKTVTVFSTLIAVVCVVGGFVVLDRATNRAQLPLSEVDPVLALLGIGTILFGAAVYAFGTRFHAAGMGRSKNDDDESADNG